MQKSLRACTIFLCCCYLAAAQPSRLSQTLQSYNEAQKRLLVKNMGRFLYMVFQGQWDLDSAVQYTCHIYGFNRQFPYDEMIYEPGVRQEVQWLQERQPARVVAAAALATGDRKIRLLLELAIYYLHQTGREKSHLDSAAIHLAAARKLATTERWKIECDAWQGEWLYQQGQQAESESYFAAVVNRFKSNENSRRKAMALHQWALHQPFSDTMRLRHLEEAFAGYQQLGLKEQAIEVMSDIVTCYFIIDYRLARPKLAEVLALEQAAGYRHTMDTYYVRAYIDGVSSDYLSALSNTDSCIAIMTQTGDSLLYSLTCQSKGGVYDFFEKYDESYAWFHKGMARMNREPQEFWYKNFTGITAGLAFDSVPGKVLEWMNNIVANYPPQGGMDKIMIDYNRGYCYDKMGQKKEAEKHYTLVLDAIAGFPPEHTHSQLLMFYLVIGRFYANREEYAQARQLLEKGLAMSKGKDFIQFYHKAYELLSRLDAHQGRYREAYEHHQLFKFYSDSMINLSQRLRQQELNVRYETARKDQDIRHLTQEGLLRESALRQARQTRNIVIGGLALFALLAALLYNLYRAKQKSGQLIAQKNKALQQLVDEKQWLLKEVHHRVKNSLQTIVSLLELQSHYGQTDPLSAIQASQNRIYATSLLHQKLYQDENSSSVNMRVYLPELISYLQDAFETRPGIHFETQVDPIDLDISQAVPIGIIVNEVVTNAIKHAFPGKGNHAAIRVSLVMMDTAMAELQIADNGKGFPFYNDPQKTPGLGMELVFGLAEDIDGAVNIETSNGTTVFVRFKPRRNLSQEYNRQDKTSESKSVEISTV